MSHSSPPFRRRNAAAVYQQHIGPNMTPMVDVVMVILIFFMASAAIMGPEWFLKTSLPVKGQAAGTSIEPVRVRVVLTQSAVGTRVSVDGVEMAMAEVERSLGGKKSASTDGIVVLVKPAAEVPYDAVVRVHEICAKLGITKVGLTD
jgi:biopolymer transport protein ExbD